VILECTRNWPAALFPPLLPVELDPDSAPDRIFASEAKCRQTARSERPLDSMRSAPGEPLSNGSRPSHDRFAIRWPKFALWIAKGCCGWTAATPGEQARRAEPGRNRITVEEVEAGRLTILVTQFWLHGQGRQTGPRTGAVENTRSVSGITAANRVLSVPLTSLSLSPGPPQRPAVCREPYRRFESRLIFPLYEELAGGAGSLERTCLR
jgi:hypothetical protein